MADLAAPHAPGHHFAQAQSLLGQVCPAALEADLKQAAHKAARAVADVLHVTAQ